MSIWDRIIEMDEKFENTVNNNVDRNIAALKRRVSGPRWRPVKRVAGGLAIAGVVTLFLTYWVVLVGLVGLSIILGLAAKA
ncbi:MAG: hypothetical protein KBS66_02820 [Eubacterium sp.]|nr:hypothetical protein [Candidatus Colimonas fimequi]